MRILTSIIITLALIWAGYWFWAARAERQAVARFLASRQAAGWTAETSGYTVRGFPSRFDLTLNALSLGQPAHGFVWHTPFLQLGASSYAPFTLQAHLPGEQRFDTPAGPVGLQSGRIYASLQLVPGLALRLRQLTARLDTPRLSLPDGATLALSQILLDVVPVAGVPHQQDITLDAGDIALPPEAKAMLDPKGALPDLVKDLHLGLRADLDRPLDLRSTEAPPRLTALTLRDCRLIWGPMRITASGQLHLDAEGRPEGQIRLTIRDWQPLIDMAVAQGLLKPGIAPTVSNMMAALANSGGDSGEATLPLDLGGGMLSLGPLPLASLPRPADIGITQGRLAPALGALAAEIGGGGVLPGLDDAAADRTGAGEIVEQLIAVAHADRALQRKQLLGEAAEDVQHGLAVGQEHVAPHRRDRRPRSG